MKERDTEMMWQTLQSSQQYFAFKNDWQRTYVRGMIRKHKIWVEASKHVKVSGVFWIIVLCKDDSTQIPWFSRTTAGTAAVGLGPYKDQVSLLIRTSLLPQYSITSGSTLIELYCSLVHSSIDDCTTVLSPRIKWFESLSVIPDESEQHNIYM